MLQHLRENSARMTFERVIFEGLILKPKARTLNVVLYYSSSQRYMRFLTFDPTISFIYFSKVRHFLNLFL